VVGKLIVCATPIGNLSDASTRLLDTLRSVDLIAAEEMQQGAVVALVSDAGTPGISDPGEELIRDAIALDIPISVIPGPMAGIAALVVSGLPTNRFAFEGFLPRGKRERKQIIQQLQYEPRTLIFYEAPHRLHETLRDMCEIWGDRPAALVRELTKTYEEVLRGTLLTLMDQVEGAEIRGEIVLVIGGSSESAPVTVTTSPEEVVRGLLKSGCGPAQAARQASKRCGLPRAEAYEMAMRLNQEEE